MKALQVLMIIAVGCLVTLPLIINGASITSFDGANNAMWYSSFSSQLWAGDPYPRWLLEMNAGLGSPAFFYYPPVAFYLTSLLRPLFSTDVSGLHQLGISLAVSVTASGIFFWLWLRELTDGPSASIAAILYMITPYHLIMDIFLRGALAESWAFVWLPLILYFTHKVSKSAKWAVVGLAIIYAILIATHLPATVMFSLIPLGYTAVVAAPGQKLKQLGYVAAAMTLGVGLSGIFFYPAMTTQSFVFVDRMTKGYFVYNNWFLFSRFGTWPDDKMRFLLLAVDLAVAAVCAFGITRRVNPEKNIKHNALFWFAIASGSLFVMTELSEPIWSIITPLQKLQVPYRFNMILSLAVAALAGFAISSVRSSISADLTPVRLIALFCVFVWVPTAAWGTSDFFMPGEASDVAYCNKEYLTKREAPEYRPRDSQTMAVLDWGVSNVEERRSLLENEYDGLLQRTGASAKDPIKVLMIEGAGHAEVITWKPREILLHTTSPTGMTAQTLQFYYPGWQAQMVGSSTALDLRPSEPDGLLTLDVPAGEYDVSIRLGQTEAERIGKNITLVSLVLLVLYVFIIGTNKLLTAQRMPVQ